MSNMMSNRNYKRKPKHKINYREQTKEQIEAIRKHIEEANEKISKETIIKTEEQYNESIGYMVGPDIDDYDTSLTNVIKLIRNAETEEEAKRLVKKINKR